jgi:threonine aldolase
MTANRINLYSDTQTKPTAAMRRAMAEAEVGDEQRGEDPTVNRLQERVAELLGKEAALFLPSGTMCNEIAIAVHCRPGDEVVCDRLSHIIVAEGGGPAALSGVMLYPIDTPRGIFTGDQVRRAVRFDSRYLPRSRLVSIENTANMGGGAVWPLAAVEDVAAAAREKGLAVHMDGARLMNAVVASGTPAKAYGAACDSIWLDLTKGLGAPVGAVLAGSKAFVAEAWRLKQRWGGAMRQAGIVAAGGLHALDHHVERLAEDHANAQALARGLAELPGIEIDPAAVETNLVYFGVAGTGLAPAEICARLEARGVLMGPTGPATIRAVTHLDVSRADVEAALAAMRSVLADAGG